MSGPGSAAPEALGLTQLPLFPLQTVLFPDGHLSLRIFEVRYLDMIGRCHKAGAPFGVVTLTVGGEVQRRDPRAEPGSDAYIKEVFYPHGVLAHIQTLEKPQPGLYAIRCQGQQRFEVLRRTRLPHGLWVGDVKLLPPDTKVPVPEELASVPVRLQRVIKRLSERQPGAADQLPMQPPFLWNDAGWVANRWSELLPASVELKQRLMTLDSPLMRLELIEDLLDRMGLDP